MPLIFIAGIILLVGLFLFAVSLVVFADIVLLFVLLYYKQYVLALCAGAIAIFFETVRWYKKDMFTQACQEELSKAAKEIEDEEAVNNLFIHEGPRYVQQKLETSRTGAYALFCAPHKCANQATTLYSPSKRYKVTVQHTACAYYFFYQQNEFTLIWEQAEHGE